MIEKAVTDSPSVHHSNPPKPIGLQTNPTSFAITGIVS